MKNKLIIFLFLTALSNLFASDVLRTISVVGTGQMAIKPDTVVISTGVDSGNPVIGLALEHNNRVMAGIFDGLADLGITEDEIETNNYNVYLHTPYNEKDNSVEEFKVSNSIKISIKNLNLVDAVIDTLVTLGANKINGIYFTFENETLYQEELRTKAMKDARNKAEFLASLEDMKVCNVISITEQGANNSVNNRNYAYEMSSVMAKSSISSGMESLSISYNVTYEIRPK